MIGIKPIKDINFPLNKFSIEITFIFSLAGNGHSLFGGHSGGGGDDYGPFF